VERRGVREEERERVRFSRLGVCLIIKKMMIRGRFIRAKREQRRSNKWHSKTIIKLKGLGAKFYFS